VEHVSPDRRRPEKRQEILRVSLLLMGITVAGKVLAYVVQAKKAAYFGIGPVVDCFEWALFFPTLFYSFAANVLNALLVPLFSGRPASDSLARAHHALVSWSLAGFFALGGVLFLSAPWLVDAFSGFDDPPRRALAVTFLRILAGATLFIGLEGVQGGFLLAERRVVTVALVRLLKEIVFVGVMVTGFGWFAARVLPVGWLASAAVGGLIFFALGLRRHRFAFRLVHVDDYIVRLLRNLWPVLVLFALINLNELVRIHLLSMRPNDLATFRYAYYLFLLPHVLVAENLVLFLFPLMAAEINAGDLDRLRHSIRSGVKLLLFFILPASAGLIVLAQPIVRLLYERRAFQAEDTLATALPLVILALGMWAFSLHVLFARILDALQAYWRRVAVESFFVALSVGLAWWWISRYGYNGAAWAITAPTVLLLGLELWQVRRKIGAIRMRLIAGDLVKIAAATALMAGTAKLVYMWTISWRPGDDLPAQLARLGATIAAAVAVYGACSVLLRIIRRHDIAELRDYVLLRKRM